MKAFFAAHKDKFLTCQVPILFLLSFFFLSWGWQFGLRVYDEGLAVYGAVRVLHGDIPFRDFRSIYPPGQFYLLALLFRLFGISLKVERIYSVVLFSLISVLAYLISRKLASAKWAVLTWILTMLWLTCFGFLLFGTPGPPALALSLLSCFFLIRYLQEKRRPDLWISGIVAGATVLFRHDMGMYVICAETVVLMLFLFFADEEKQRWRVSNLLRIPKSYGPYVAAVLLPAAPIILLLLYFVPTRYLAADLVEWPSIYKQVRSIPFPAPAPNPLDLFRAGETAGHYFVAVLERFVYYFPIFVYSIISLKLLFIYKSRRQFAASSWSVLLVLLVGIAFFNHARIRSDVVHLFSTVIPATILLPTLFVSAEIESRPRIPSFFKAAAAVLFLIMAVSLTRYLVYSLPPTSGLAELTLRRAKGIRLFPGDARNLEDAVKFVRAQVPEGKPIFVGNFNHDRVINNDIMFYFLAERESPTRYYHFDPGVTTTREVQQEIIKDLEERQVNCIVLWSGDQTKPEPNLSGVSSGVTDLDDYIRRRFPTGRVFGDHVVLLRQDIKLSDNSQ